MTSGEQITVREIFEWLGDFRTEMSQRFDKIEVRLNPLESHLIADEAVESERAKTSLTRRWFISLAVATSASVALGLINLVAGR